ncbi:MAG: hypothetical protein ABR556_11005, partial [Pyrinomonadaceae bacterium]
MKHRIVILVAILALAVGTTFTIHKAKASPGSKAKPDLIVDQKKLLRFTVSTPNIGTADVNLGDPNDHIAANDGLYELA